MELFLFEDSWHRQLPGEICSSAKRWSRKRLAADHVRTRLNRTRLDKRPRVEAKQQKTSQNGNNYPEKVSLLNDAMKCMRHVCRSGLPLDMLSDLKVMQLILEKPKHADRNAVASRRTAGGRAIDLLYVSNNSSVQKYGFTPYNQRALTIKLEDVIMKPSAGYECYTNAVYLRVYDDNDTCENCLEEICIGSTDEGDYPNDKSARVDFVCQNAYDNLIYVCGAELNQLATQRNDREVAVIQYYFFRLFPLIFVGGLAVKSKDSTWLTSGRPIVHSLIEDGVMELECTDGELLVFDIEKLLQNDEQKCWPQFLIGDEAQAEHFSGDIDGMRFEELSEKYYFETKKKFRIGMWPCGLPTLIAHSTNLTPIWRFPANNFSLVSRLSACGVPFLISYADKLPYYKLYNLIDESLIEQFSNVEYGLNVSGSALASSDEQDSTRDDDLLSILHDGIRCTVAVEYGVNASLVVKRIQNCHGIVSVQPMYRIRPLNKVYGQKSLQSYPNLNIKCASKIVTTSVDEDLRILSVVYGEEAVISTRIVRSWVQLHDFVTGRFLSWFLLRPFRRARKSDDDDDLLSDDDDENEEVFYLYGVGDIGAVHYRSRRKPNSEKIERFSDFYQLIR